MTAKSIIEALVSKGLTRAQIAERIGRSIGSISRWAAREDASIRRSSLGRLEILFKEVFQGKPGGAADLEEYTTHDLVNEIRERGWAVTLHSIR